MYNSSSNVSDEEEESELEDIDMLEEKEDIDMLEENQQQINTALPVLQNNEATNNTILNDD